MSLQLGTETGSLINHLYSRSKSIKPEVGMAATLLGWSDRTPATVIETFTKGKYDYFVVQEDNYKRVDDNGMSESQEYEYTRNPDGITFTFRVVDGGFEGVFMNKETGRFKKSDRSVLVGKRERYYDFSF